jgi:CBS domain-containing protein
MRVADLLKKKNTAPLITVKATDSLKEAIKKLDYERIGATLVVNDGGRLVGMLSERDLIGVFAEYGDRALLVNVGALMTRRVFGCTPDDDIEDVMAWMVQHRVRHLPVVEDGRVQGMVSIGDVVKHRLDEVLRTEQQLHDYIAGTGYQ